MVFSLRWRAHLSRQTDNPALRVMLKERHSLTLHLRRGCRHFEVRCLAQSLQALSHDEAACLGVRPGQMAWTREVLLVTDGQPAVFGHTVMLRHPRHPFDISFHALGSHALGRLLFSNPRIARGGLAFSCLDARHPFYQRAAAALHAPLPTRLWARRSRFSHQAKGVLVTEVFLPAASPGTARHIPNN